MILANGTPVTRTRSGKGYRTKSARLRAALRARKHNGPQRPTHRDDR